MHLNKNYIGVVILVVLLIVGCSDDQANQSQQNTNINTPNTPPTTQTNNVSTNANQTSSSDTISTNDTDTDNTDSSIIDKLGASYKQTGNNVEVLIDQETAVNIIPTLQKTGTINPDITQTEINAYPEKYAGYMGLFYTTAIIPEIYKNTDSNQIHVNGYLLSPDDYGNPKKHLIFSFNFSRALTNKIDWLNLSVGKLIKIAPNFTLSPWYRNKIDDSIDN